MPFWSNPSEVCLWMAEDKNEPLIEKYLFPGGLNSVRNLLVGHPYIADYERSYSDCRCHR